MSVVVGVKVSTALVCGMMSNVPVVSNDELGFWVSCYGICYILVARSACAVICCGDCHVYVDYVYGGTCWCRDGDMHEEAMHSFVVVML